MARDLFSVPIFFIIFRETIEASIIISVLLSFVEQLVYGSAFEGTKEDNDKRVRGLIKRMRIQIWAGALSGLLIAFAIGAAFVAVFYTKLSNLWQNSEAIWEGVFSIIASLVILIMGVAFLRMDRSRAKWRIKLQAAFHQSDPNESTSIMSMFKRNKKDKNVSTPAAEEHALGLDNARQRSEAQGGKWALFLLPFITVLREGLEAVIFVAGVSISQPASATPIAVIVGLLAGFLVGWLIYRGGSAFALHTFLIISTCILFLVGAGLFSKGVGYLEIYPFLHGAGGDVAETGEGPGSYDVGSGNVVWHVNYGNPEITSNGGWMIFNAILGWTSTATYGTILSYVFYWLVIAVTLMYLKFKEGRMALFGRKSKVAKEREARKAERASLGEEGEGNKAEKVVSREGSGSGSSDEGHATHHAGEKTTVPATEGEIVPGSQHRL